MATNSCQHSGKEWEPGVKYTAMMIAELKATCCSYVLGYPAVLIRTFSKDWIVVLEQDYRGFDLTGHALD